TDSALMTLSNSPAGGFGGALAFNREELWVGAASAGHYGGIAVFEFDAYRTSWSMSQSLVPYRLPRGASVGNPLAVKGDIGIGAAPRSGWYGEAIVFQRDLNGVWWEDESLTATGLDLDAIVGGKLDCEGGKADQFNCEGIELLSFLPVSDIGGGAGSTAADIWGWTDPETGREYVLANRNDGTAFVDVTDPENPVFIGDLPMTETAVANLWRDVKTYKNYALIVADNVGVHGMQIFDLRQLRDVENPPVTFEPTVLYSEINSAHNVIVNEETGFAYIVGASDGGNTCGGALHMVDINDPLNPTFAGCFDNPTRPSGIHDSQCVTYRGPDERFTGREICLSSDGDMLSIADVTDKANPEQLVTISYPDEGYAHQGWLTDDQRYFYQNDEGDELVTDFGGTRTLIWDLQELDDPILTGQYIAENKASDHNLYIRGNLMYESNYVSGLRIIDISDPVAPKEVGHLDTVPWGEDLPGFAGSWSNYPFFESGTIAVSSIREGLFLVRKTDDVVP
ncbi:MAG: choice-of-anchor B family protein, partial [Rhodothermia bacterium]